MLHLITYDLEDDRIRRKVGLILENAGMDRIQYSVFIGLLNKTEKKAVLKKIENLITGHDLDYHLLCLPLHNDMLSGLNEFAKVPIDWEYLKGEKPCMIF